MNCNPIFLFSTLLFFGTEEYLHFSLIFTLQVFLWYRRCPRYQWAAVCLWEPFPVDSTRLCWIDVQQRARFSPLVAERDHWCFHFLSAASFSSPVLQPCLCNRPVTTLVIVCIIVDWGGFITHFIAYTYTGTWWTEPQSLSSVLSGFASVHW